MTLFVRVGIDSAKATARLYDRAPSRHFDVEPGYPEHLYGPSRREQPQTKPSESEHRVTVWTDEQAEVQQRHSQVHLGLLPPRHREADNPSHDVYAPPTIKEVLLSTVAVTVVIPTLNEARNLPHVFE